MPFEPFRAMAEAAGYKNVPRQKGLTLGESRIDLGLPREYNEDGIVVKGDFRGGEFGKGNCFGFIGVFLGRKTAENPLDYSLLGLQDEKIRAGVGDEGRVYKSPGSISEAPKGGLIPYLKQGRQLTQQPKFGAIALFIDKGTNEITHGGIVLGRSRAGKVYVLQKLSPGKPYTVTPVDHPALYPTMTRVEYYQ